MRLFLKIIKNKIKSFLARNNYISAEVYDFNKSNPLGGDGERVDIQLQNVFNFEKLDIYQKNHFRRYEFAKEIINKNDVCGDFACGTGYGSILISDKASKVIGADLDLTVVNAIKKRYKKNNNVEFIHENLLNLTYNDYFDSIISFETIEHFVEDDIKSLLGIFSNALKENGKLIFSTPYLQEKSEAAMKLGFHLTFNIDENKIRQWFDSVGLKVAIIKYQNYETHTIENQLMNKDFILCVANKISNG